MLHDARDKFSELPRGVRRIIFAVLLFVDANFLGTLNGYGSLNILDMLLGDALPNDMVWLIQLIESITAGFVVIKVLFDDVPSSPLRTLSLLLSPFFMVAVTFYSLDLLLQDYRHAHLVLYLLGNCHWFDLDLQGSEIRKFRPI